MLHTVYGKVSTNEFKPTFDDPVKQAEFIADVKDMYSKLSDEQFNKHWVLRLQEDDKQVLDALYDAYQRRQILG